jgi:chromosome segregation ATPase
MEADQVEQKLNWLDEQRRKDLSALGSLDDRLTTIEDALKAQSERIEQANSEMARLSTLAARISEFDEALHLHRMEVTRQLKETTERREERLKNQDELRKSDFDALATKMSQLRSDVDGLAGFEEAIDIRRDEGLKLSRQSDELEKRLTDLEDRANDQLHSISSLAENAKSDAKRLGEVQTDVTAARSRVEATQGTIDLLQDRVRRYDTQISELAAGERERHEALDVWMENQSRKLVDFERQWNTWEERFSSFEEQASELERRMVQYEETFRGTKQLQDSLEKVIERLERRINEISEMQRLAQDRIQQEWTTFQADDQKRWSTYKLTNDEHWREHQRSHDQSRDELETLRQGAERSQRDLERIASGVDQRVRSLLALASKWAQDLEN